MRQLRNAECSNEAPNGGYFAPDQRRSEPGVITRRSSALDHGEHEQVGQAADPGAKMHLA